ncbi:MAG: phage holin family protein [Thermoflexaceae bacterium]|nr:phage holin family protein [Thermoflexaceae bacterium]
MAADPESSLGDAMRRGREELRDVGDEFAGIVSDLREVARGEVELAKAEMGEQVSALVRTAIWGGVAAVLGLLALTWVFVTMTLVLDMFMDAWAAAAVTLGVLAVLTIGAGLAAASRMKQVTIVPKRTVHSVREDVQWAKDQLKSRQTTSAGATH